jgi:nucleotide-binding universal stress UspA family protein
MYKTIMVPLDGSELAECVLPYVEAFVNQCQVQTIVFIRVLEPLTSATAREYSISLEEMEKREMGRKNTANLYLKEVAGRLKADGTKLKTEVLIGRVADELAEYAENSDIDLILIATHGRSGISRWVRGSVADRILRSASLPVMMIRAPGSVSDKQV